MTDSLLKIIFTIALLTPVTGRAGEVINSCWDATGQNHVTYKISTGSFANNRAGSTAIFTFKPTIATISTKCWYENKGQYDTYINRYYSSLLMSSSINNFFNINKDIDIRVKVYGIDLPAFRNGIFKPQNPNDGKVFDQKVGLTYPAPEITIKLKKDQLSGILYLPKIMLYQENTSFSFNSADPNTINNNTPTFIAYIEDSYIPLPIMCKINDNNPINIEFGDLDNTKITQDGSNYLKTIPLKYQCDTPITQNIAVQLVASPAAFSSNLIASSMPDDIGVMLKYNGEIVKPNSTFNTILTDGFGQDELQAAPVINTPLKPITGDFTASATLLMSLL
ncbi:fimbrial protein [Providencia rettgeri]|uniref:fimbrial protein n=1 Tax=Providencia rettgeri TaxID=587 RepID=UPI00029C07E3|nr:fimbrial protein [Providencia rettgeri]EKT57783.1 minor fimbrial subunit (mannose-resistance fimbriae), MrfF protein [Providencia rettgeri Dmel1]